MLPESRKEQVVVVRQVDEDAHDLSASISKHIRGAEIVEVNSVESLRAHLGQQLCDIVVLDYELVRSDNLTLVQELRLLEHEPGIVIVSDSFTSEEVASLYNSGCSRCLVDHPGGHGELGLAVRHLIRMRRLEEENRRLIAKLTEANALMAEKNKRLDEFSGTVAHDIRGPLGGISMRLEYLRDIYKDDLDDRFREVLEGSLAASRRLIDVVQAMYEFAKLGTHAQKIDQIDLVVFVQEVIEDLQFDEKLDIEVGLGDLPVVWANPGLLRKVFINLISNAVKYTDKDKIVINIALNSIKQRSIGCFAEIYVEDNGPGIPKENHDKIFNIFNRGGAPENTEGMGIGLAVVKRVVELHYGSLRLESKSGQGAKFIFSLPIEEIDLTI